MLSFFRKKEYPEVPEWADFFTAKEYAAFTQALDNYFSNQQVDYQIDDGVMQLKESWYGMDNLGLTNVAQNCKQQGTGHYSEIIGSHFDAMRRSQEYEVHFNKLLADFTEIQAFIGIRVYSDDYIAHIGRENVVGKDLGAGIFALLVYDLPDSIKNVSPKDLEPWGKTEDELITLGIANIRANYTLQFSQEKIGQSSVLFAHDEHFFVSNLVFEFERNPELLGKHGSLVGLPHRHATLIYPIEDIEVVKAVNELIPIIIGMNNEGPGSISNQLMWYRNGLLLNLPYEISEEAFRFIPPDEFVQTLNQLAENQNYEN